MTKSIIIIGAGIAGLSAGCYAQMNGYDSSIYEKHSISGGLCTSWTRGQYTFDGSIDWLTGSAPDGMFYPLWQEAGAIKGKRFFITMNTAVITARTEEL
jgi:phytoene dehydrogenase-like protein